MAEVLRIEHIAVKKDRMVIDVVVAPARHAYTTPALIGRLLPFYPHLLEHACVNQRGATFGAVAQRTSLPHLLEHMIIEEQARLEDESAQPVLYTGKSYWTNEPQGKARVEVRYADDLVALRALRVASERLNAAVVQ